jgi:phenylacetate-CoA ligase
MPILEAIEGRFEDICITRDGRQVLRFDTVFKGVENIKQAQVIQTAIDRFEILVEPAPSFGEHDISLLQTNMRQHVGDVMTIVTPADELSRSASGKFRAVVCRLTEEEKRAALSQRGRRDA